MKNIALISLILLAVASGPAAARQASAPTVSSTPPSAQALALTRRYLAAMHVNESIKPMMNNMMSAMIEQQIQARPGMTAQQRTLTHKVVVDAFSESLNAGMLDRIFEAMVPGIAQVFSEPELRAMVDFYESPVGQSIIAKMPEYGRVSSGAIMAIVPEMQADLEQRVRANLEAVGQPVN